MKKNKSIFFSVLVFLTLNSHSQTDWPCEEEVHGMVLVHVDCDTDIVITSFSEDGAAGSVIQGIITSSEKIIIKPGNTSVRIVPTGSNRPNKGQGVLVHTTKLGNGGEVGRRASSQSKIKKEIDWVVYPNTLKENVNIHTATEKITGYQLTNIYGKVLKKVFFKPTNQVDFSALALKKGVYILRIQLENGTHYTKKIIKN